MASLEKVKDAHGWVAVREAFEASPTKSKVNPSRWLFNLEYEVLEEGFSVSDSHIEGGMMEGVTPQIRDVTDQRQIYTYVSEALTY